MLEKTKYIEESRRFRWRFRRGYSLLSYLVESAGVPGARGPREHGGHKNSNRVWESIPRDFTEVLGGPMTLGLSIHSTRQTPA